MNVPGTETEICYEVKNTRRRERGARHDGANTTSGLPKRGARQDGAKATSGLPKRGARHDGANATSGLLRGNTGDEKQRPCLRGEPGP